MRKLSKLWTPGPLNKSRFHDEKGNRIDILGLYFLPSCLFSLVWRTLTGRRLSTPWLSYRATKRLGRILKERPSSVLEFGSGMSTLWFAKKADRVVSIESDPPWHSIIRDELARRHFDNVEYKLITTEDYSEASICQDAAFELVLVDGWMRGACAVTAVRKVKPGGYIYLDNSDKAKNDPEIAFAEAALLAAARPGGFWYFTDFGPNFFVVWQGLLVQV